MTVPRVLGAQRAAGNAAVARWAALARCPDGSDPDCPCHDEEHEQDEQDDLLEGELARTGRQRRAVARQRTDDVSSSGAPALAGTCPFPIGDVTLFEQLERTWPLFGKSAEFPVWDGRADLGWLGWVDFKLLAGAGAEASLLTSLGPGVIRDICLSADPANACVSGTGTLAIPADAAPDLLLTGSLTGSADYLGSIPLAKLLGELQTRAGGTAHPEVAIRVDLTYEDGKLSVTAAADLSMALELSFDLDASLLAELFGEEVYNASWNLIAWRWSRLWNVIGRIQVAMNAGVPVPPRLEFVADDVSLEQVLRDLFSDLIDPDSILDGLRGSSVATTTEIIDPMSAVVTRAAIEAQDYATALDVVVRSLAIDTSICTIEFVDDSSQGEGLTEARFNDDNQPEGPATISIFTPAFADVPLLVSTVMHEYQHARQFQQGQEPGELAGDPAAAAVASEAREVEAYLWEIEHADETGLNGELDRLEDVGGRLKDHYDALGELDAKRQATFRKRYEAAQASVQMAASCVANENLSEIADTFISRCRKASIRREFPGELLNETLGAIKRGSSATHKKAWKLLNDNRFKK